MFDYRPITESKRDSRKDDCVEPSFTTIKIRVLIDKFADIAKFVALTSKCEDDVVAVSQNYRVNAKSLLGLYSLDLSTPIKVEFYGDIPDEIKNDLRKFMVKG